MIEYKVLKADKSPVTLEDIEEMDIAIECVFPKTDREKVGSKIRESYGVNGHSFHMYYGEKNTVIGLPEKYQKEIKKTLKNVAQLKFKGN